MASRPRTDVHEILTKLCDNVYYQPPSNIQLTYPCIIYRKTGVVDLKAGNTLFHRYTVYTLTLIDRNPDTTLIEEVEKHFPHTQQTQPYSIDNLHHQTLIIHY